MIKETPLQKSVFRGFLKSEAASGIILICVAVCALWVANSTLASFYFSVLEIHIGNLSLLHWINDAFMALFFLIVGLEIKRELINGQLSTWSRRILPGIGAIGGMIAPALIYVSLNFANPIAQRGWAIPCATDIAFSLGILALLGSRVPLSLKVFLTALAIIDDLLAVIIIALFYTSNLNLEWFLYAGATITVLCLLNYFKVQNLIIYLILGVFLWFCVHQSGIHATLAGVILAFTIPLKQDNNEQNSPLYKLEHALQPWVSFLIVPVFGFANAGVSLEEVNVSTLFDPVTLGVALGLFLGKQLGIFLSVWISIKTGLAQPLHKTTWVHIYGVSILAGIGFTMSLFIGLLAFPLHLDIQNTVKVGVLLGSALSAFIGGLILFITLKKDQSLS